MDMIAYIILLCIVLELCYTFVLNERRVPPLVPGGARESAEA